MDNIWKITMLWMGKLTITGWNTPCSIAMLVITRWYFILFGVALSRLKCSMPVFRWFWLWWTSGVGYSVYNQDAPEMWKNMLKGFSSSMSVNIVFFSIMSVHFDRQVGTFQISMFRMIRMDNLSIKSLFIFNHQGWYSSSMLRYSIFSINDVWIWSINNHYFTIKHADSMVDLAANGLGV